MLLNQQLLKLDFSGGIVKDEEWEEVGKVKSKERAQRQEGGGGKKGRGLTPLGRMNPRRARPALDVFTTPQTE